MRRLEKNMGVTYIHRCEIPWIRESSPEKNYGTRYVQKLHRRLACIKQVYVCEDTIFMYTQLF